ncbi:MAG: hypothetical protein M1608_00720 [Candidatus Omnitrophica bacterium]|nr:hypothetical protein [Candidatus Omnitrophota bacterium]
MNTKATSSVLLALVGAWFNCLCRAAEPTPLEPTPTCMMRPVLALGYQQQPLAYNEVHPAGFLADRINLSLDKLILDQAGHTGYLGWGADQIGRWIGAVSAQAAVIGRNVEAEVGPKAQELIRAQDAHGIFYGDKIRPDTSVGDKLQVWFGQGRAL